MYLLCKAGIDLPKSLTETDIQRSRRVDHLAQDENRVRDAESDQQMVEGVAHPRLHEDHDGHDVAGEAEHRSHRRRNARQPETPTIQGLE